MEKAWNGASERDVIWRLMRGSMWKTIIGIFEIFQKFLKYFEIFEIFFERTIIFGYLCILCINETVIRTKCIEVMDCPEIIVTL